MRANDFVKNFGLGEAKEAIGKVAWCETAYCLRLGHGCFKSASDCCVDVTDLKRLVESHELVERLGGFERVTKAIEGKHIGYTHFYLDENDRYIFLDHYNDFIPDHAQHIGMFNKVIADVASCKEVA